MCATLVAARVGVLARPATSLDQNAGPVALERGARSAITEALQQTMSTYEDMGAHPIPVSMQGKLFGTPLVGLKEEAEQGTAQAAAQTTDLRRPRTTLPRG